MIFISNKTIKDVISKYIPPETVTFGSRYSRMDQVKFVEGSL